MCVAILIIIIILTSGSPTWSVSGTSQRNVNFSERESRGKAKVVCPVRRLKMAEGLLWYWDGEEICFE